MVGIALLHYQKAEAITDSLEVQFQPVTFPSVPAVTEMVEVALRSYFLTHASEPKLTNSDGVQETISSLKVGKTPGRNGIPNRALKHFPERAVSSSRFSTRFSVPITFLQRANTLY
jgi:hypothetical protein